MTNNTILDIGSDRLREIREVDHARRDAPDAAFIEQMRERFPSEAEYDRMLTRKAESRADPRQAPSTLEDLRVALDAFLDAKVKGPHRVDNMRWLSGGASKLQAAFSLEWNDPLEGLTTSQLVLRMEPQESLNATSRTREYELINALGNYLPVPRAYWVDDAAEFFPQSTLIYALASGVSKPHAVEGRPSGVGSAFDSELRAEIGPQFVAHLATLHSLEAASLDLPSFDLPRVGTTDTAVWQLNRTRRVWEEDRAEEFPLWEVAANWLERNAPELDRVSVLHGDYRTGNFLFDEDTKQITTWLDWERGHLGDRHRDLAWATLPTFGNLAEDGKTVLVVGLVPYDEFISEYERLSGLTVDPVRLRYYRILNTFQLIASTLGTGSRVIRLAKSHQDVLLAWLEGVVYSLGEELRTSILEES
ncbi:phosphotransferase family protein [Microbacterium sp. A93]|uniref:phosphotransferase family protein n=1 Tax=Microbacterium sp. A93 TaxID=3450716 RepID=UPI003F43FA1B